MLRSLFHFVCLRRVHFGAINGRKYLGKEEIKEVRQERVWGTIRLSGN